MSMRTWLSNHSLSIIFIGLFVASIIAQSISGHISYNSRLAIYHLPAIGYFGYLHTGDFLDGMFTNWQAAFLQLLCLIVFAAFFRERGAAHSLSPRARARRRATVQGRPRSWTYRYSFSLALALLFLLSFCAHLFFGTMEYNSELQMMHQPPITTVSYGLSSQFWFTTTQTWEAEFAAMAIYVLLSVFLRQDGSPESKPVDSSNRETGKTNR